MSIPEPLSNSRARAATAAAGTGRAQSWSSVFTTSRDGLQLHLRDHRPEGAGSALPLVCLAGLTRTSADFDDLAAHEARYARTRRRVLAIDYRGRGLSERDSNWRNYHPRIEAADVLDQLAAAGIAHAAFLGTSRGAIVMTAIAAMRPALIRAAIINDIGPVIDGLGLARIRQSVGKLPRPASYAEAASLLRQMSDQQFPALSASDWLVMAMRTWKAENGALVPDYDPNLRHELSALDLEKPLPEFWTSFAGFNDIPLMSIRGSRSDIFSAATQAEMARRHKRCTVYVAEDQGHAPLLADPASHIAIEVFLEGCA